MEAFEIMISESQERMLCVVEPDRVDEVVAVCEKWLVNATAIGEVTATRGGCACSTATRWSATCRSPRWSTSARSTTSSRSRPRSRCTRRRAAVARRARRPATRSSRCCAPPTSRRAAGRSSSTTASSARAPCAAPRQADAAVLALPERRRDRRLDRRQRPPRRLRPVPRRGRGRARVLGQPRLRRRRAARADQLPQLRQPGEAPHRLAAHARGRGPRRRLPRARRSRSSAATCRSTTRPAPARSSRPRSSGWSASCRRPRAPAASASRRRATSSPSSRPAHGRRRSPAPSWRSCAARRRSASCPQADLGELRTLHAAVRQAVRAGALRSAHDVAEGGLAVALAECCLAGGVGRARRPRAAARARARRCCSARARARSSCRATAQSLRAFGGAAVLIGVGRRLDLVIDGVLSVGVAELATAHAGGLAACSASERQRRLGGK